MNAENLQAAAKRWTIACLTVMCLALVGCETGRDDDRASLPVAEYDDVAVNAYF